MFEKIKENIINFFTSRLTLLSVAFILMGLVLLKRCFDLQIVHGQEYLDKFMLTTEKTRDVSASRGSIYDSNGILLAYDELAYSVKIEDVFDKSTKKNSELNGTISTLIDLIEKNGDHTISDFNIILDDTGKYAFNVEGSKLKRFLADIYGKTSYDKLEIAQQNATPDDVIEYLCGKSGFGIGDYLDPSNNKSDFIVGKGYTKEKLLKILTIRYSMKLTSYRKYVGTVVAKDVCTRTVAVVLENNDILPGVSITEDTVRKYNYSEYFAHLLGYVGKIDADEVIELNNRNYEEGGSNERYSINDVVGKGGIENYCETILQGTKGMERVSVDNMGKVISVLEKTDAYAGNDVYLTIDSNLQIAAYHILEQHIAGILAEKIINTKEYIAGAHSSAGDIKIPIYDVYFATINNGLIDINHFDADDAKDIEISVYNKYLNYKEQVYNRLESEMSGGIPYNKLTLEYQNYESHIVNSILIKNGILDSSLIDTENATYIAWTTDEVISMREYLRYCISQNWINTEKLKLSEQYSDSEEIYRSICQYVMEELEHNLEFQKKIYRFMIKNDVISGKEICTIICEQNLVEIPEEAKTNLLEGKISSYTFMMDRIKNLEITPKQLALDPCSGSVVITDMQGHVKALVSYPGYDNNKMANSVDSEYYSKLLTDKTSPLMNYATQYKAAPGSTYKMVSATAALMEGVSTLSSVTKCVGQYKQITPSPWCWKHVGHGDLNVTGAIQNSCNYYFYDVGYKLSTKSGSYSAKDGLDTLAKYADLYGLSEKSGIEIEEYTPSVSDELPIPSAIGQGTNSYTAVGLTRYVSTIANGGNCYNLTLLKQYTDAEGNLLKTIEPTVRNRVDMPETYWDAIKLGMKKVVEGKAYFRELGLECAGKTGTAEQIKSRPNHALFVGFAPYADPQIAITVRIPFGFSSDYAAQTTKDIISYYFGLEEADDLLSGTADAPEAGVSNNEI